MGHLVRTTTETWCMALCMALYGTLIVEDHAIGVQIQPLAPADPPPHQLGKLAGMQRSVNVFSQKAENES